MMYVSGHLKYLPASPHSTFFSIYQRDIFSSVQFGQLLLPVSSFE